MTVISFWRITYANISYRHPVILNGRVHHNIIWRFFWSKVQGEKQ